MAAKRDIKVYANRAAKLETQYFKLVQSNLAEKRRLELRHKRFENDLYLQMSDARDLYDRAKTDWNERHPNDKV